MQHDHPEAGVGDGEELVVADVVAAGLPRVAVEILLVVAPHLLSSHNHEPEDEHHGEPYAAEDGGVLVDSVQEALEKGPIHDVLNSKQKHNFSSSHLAAKRGEQ
uniref:Uncharacterized protein n=1 Tax=Gadus morhua TaxID=8049 RepID=A0A8C5AV91_GADMO